MANSNLIANLNSIYATKLEIKEVLNTESDDFTEYPDLIEAAIASGGASGYAYITENGDHDIATYAYVNVNVPQQEVPVVPPGYSYVYGTKEILENGTVDISSYASAYVNVPAPEGWILPSGYAFVTSNGNFDIREFESVNVNVPQGGAAVLGNLTVTENGQYSASSYSYDGFDVVDVNVPAVTPVLNSLSVSANGVYTPQTGVDGFNEVTVNVPSGGSSHSGQSTADAWTIEDAYSYISAFEDTAEHMAADLGFEPVVEGVVASVLPNRDYSSQYPTARFWITRDGSAVAADYSNGILCWNMQSNLAGTWTEGIDMQIYPGQHVFIQCTKLQKYLDSNTGNYQMECKNGTAIVRQTSANGQLTISQSGTYDTTSYVSAYVNVQGGGGADILSVTGVWMANAISDGVNTYQMMVSGSVGGLNGGLDSYSFGTYVTGNIISIWSQDCLTKYQNGHEIYCENYDTDYNSEITATSGTFNWDATNQVVNPNGGFYWSEQNFGWITRRNYNFTDDLGTTYRISAYDYNTYNNTTANLIINWWEDPNDPGQRYAAIVGTDA